jgi:hypothetical protein
MDTTHSSKSDWDNYTVWWLCATLESPLPESMQETSPSIHVHLAELATWHAVTGEY